MGFLVLIVAGGALGTWALRGLDVGGAEGLASRLFTGLCLSAVVIVAVGSVSLRMTHYAMLALAAGGIAYGGWSLLRGGRTEEGGLSSAGPLNRLELACLVAIVLANGLAMLSALAPNTSWDAGVAHLALPLDYSREGRIQFLEGNAYSAYPHLLHSLYTYAFSQGGERAASLLNWVFGPLGCMAVFALGKRVEGRQCGLIAAAMFSTSPIFFDQVGLVSLDVPFAGMTMAALACLVVWHDEKRPGWLVLAAFLAGSSCGIRHTGYLVCALMWLGVLLGGRERRVAAAAVFGGVAVLAASPWLLRSALVVGNPFFPFLKGVFSPGLVLDDQTTGLATHESIRGMGLLDLALFPWNIIMRPEAYDGWSRSPGGLVLLLGPPGLIVGGAKARWLGAFSVVGGVCFFFFQRMARYLLPFLAPMMVVAAVAACRLDRLRRPIAVLLVFTFCYGLALGMASVHFKVPVALGFETPEAYLARRVERYAAFEWVNRNVPATDTVATLDPRSYFIKGPTFQNFVVLDRLREMSLDDQMRWFKERNIRYLLYPNRYVDEVTFFRAHGYLDILNGWRNEPGFFRLAEVLDIPRIRSKGSERVEIYEILFDGGEAETGGPIVGEEAADVDP